MGFSQMTCWINVSDKPDDPSKKNKWNKIILYDILHNRNTHQMSQAFH